MAYFLVGCQPFLIFDDFIVFVLAQISFQYILFEIEIESSLKSEIFNIIFLKLEFLLFHIGFKV